MPNRTEEAAASRATFSSACKKDGNSAAADLSPASVKSSQKTLLVFSSGHAPSSPTAATEVEGRRASPSASRLHAASPPAASFPAPEEAQAAPAFTAPSDADLAEALLLNGYRLSEDTAGDNDFTFPLDFQTPLNYEIYSFISQCLNAAQLKQPLAARDDAAALQPEGGAAAKGLAAAVSPALPANGRDRRAAEGDKNKERKGEQERKKGGAAKDDGGDGAWPRLAAAGRQKGGKKKGTAEGDSGVRKQWKKKEATDQAPRLSTPAEPGASSRASSPQSQTAASGSLPSPSASSSAPSPPAPAAGALPSSGVRAPPGLSGPDVNTALLRAAFLGREDIVDLCLKRGGDVSFSDRVGRTALHYGAATGIEKIVRKLLEGAGAKNINKRDRKHWTPLLIAVTKTHVACVRLLLEKGADVSATLCHRCAPCRSAAAKAEAADTGPERAEEGQTAKEAAAAEPRKTTAEGATKAESPKNAKHPDGKVMLPAASDAEGPVQTWSAAIHFAAIKGSIEISQLLLDHGASVNDLDSDKRPPLHYAACRDNSQYVSWLLARGARLDLFDVNGRSALHAAAMKGQLQNAQSILEAADPATALTLLKKKDTWDITPVQLAKLHGQNGAYLLLKSYADQLEASLGPLAPVLELENADAVLLSQTITEVLATGMQEVKKNKLERAVARLGTVTCLKAYQKTMMIQSMGGMLVADGSRPKTAGGVFFTLLREMARQGEITREDIIYIEMEDGEAKKALRRRARQKQTVAADAALQTARPASAARGQTRRAQTASSAAGGSAADAWASRAPATERAAGVGGGVSAPAATAKKPQKKGAAAPSLSPVGIFLSSSAPGASAAASSQGNAAKVRPGSAASSKRSGASGCTYTPLAQAISAERLLTTGGSSGGNSPQQTPTHFPSLGSFMGAGQAQQSGFFPFSMYPMYPLWPVGFPTPLSPPPIMGARLATSKGDEGAAFFSNPTFFSQGGAVANAPLHEDRRERKKNAQVVGFTSFYPGGHPNVFGAPSAPGVYVHQNREEQDARSGGKDKKKARAPGKKWGSAEEKKEAVTASRKEPVVEDRTQPQKTQKPQNDGGNKWKNVPPHVRAPKAPEAKEPAREQREGAWKTKGGRADEKNEAAAKARNAGASARGSMRGGRGGGAARGGRRNHE
ncbi:ankyrin repeat-containing protein [Besnoitia besnoiti]|uniref:Ankyrin repeat-containing protein n=1 Tax=Besnoitia besnoiti TaxID=94643 RepID=A0A2A9MDJ3_BESBE|nr:ankyrin repeat-containing protein [Besnoitia besnoiti]PFH33460.1 ankyrin repeat-containing protein [Besnoitia besnoiti]